MQAERNNIRAGILTLTCVGLFTAAIYGWLAWSHSTQVRYVVRFSADQGVYGLSKGTPVWIGGMEKGSIESITPRFSNETLIGYEIVLLVEAGIPITAAVRCEASEAGINGEAILELRGLGSQQKTRSGQSGANAQPLLAAGSEITGTAPPRYRGFFGAPMSQSVRELLAVWSPEHPTDDSLSNRLQAITEDVPMRVKKSQTEIAALSDRATPDFKRWKADYTAARDQANAAFAKLGSTQSNAPATNPGGNDQAQVLSLVRTARAEAETLPRIDSHRLTNFAETLDRAVKSIKELGEQTGSLRSGMASADHSFGRGAADFSIASQELDAAGREVMWQPWLLLGGGAEDVGSERIDIANREIVRQYTLAAVEHQYAMKGIEDALRRDGELLNTVPGLAELLRTRLDSATALFEAETKRMENLIIGPPSNTKPSK
ncbi:MAG: hypothetical protein RIR77_1817 [Planctomycetota bacterium]